MLQNESVGHILLAPGRTYNLAMSPAAFAQRCSPGSFLILEGGATSSPVRLETSLKMVIDCTLSIMRLRVIGTASPSMRVSPSGTLSLSVEARIEGPVQNEGFIRYLLPTPLGTFLSAGTLRSCANAIGRAISLCERDLGASFYVEFEALPIAFDNWIAGGLPRPCIAGYLGNTTDLAGQRQSTCSHECPKGSICPEGSSAPTLWYAASRNRTAPGLSCVCLLRSP